MLSNEYFFIKDFQKKWKYSSLLQTILLWHFSKEWESPSRINILFNDMFDYISKTKYIRYAC